MTVAWKDEATQNPYKEKLPFAEQRTDYLQILYLCRTYRKDTTKPEYTYRFLRTQKLINPFYGSKTIRAY